MSNTNLIRNNIKIIDCKYIISFPVEESNKLSCVELNRYIDFPSVLKVVRNNLSLWSN